ncbi:hypothetical protein CH293_11705 [Rhodococcus sp. 14-2470-1b]|uniref:2-keto-4-pentenoate hydratase n=1 Tax=Rhodococcus sp. 14-2470-1b TaxID=2023149 RepID=UPI000B9A96C2|nr:fumarylacetoacetate hydrolase family protein [Rhodococcus sp. 14-2470-1b]OZF53161.1 hypothetical protein CH293_11705 [Rhodococcus sp. 14-2470-1b]
MSLPTQTPTNIARHLIDAYSGAPPLDLDESIRNFAHLDPYMFRDSILDEVVRVRRGAIGGYKISLTRTKDQAALGSTGPAYGRLMRERLLPSGATVNLSTENGFLIEPELVLTAVEELNASMSITELEHRVRVAPGIELPTSRFRNWMPGSPGAGHTVHSHVLDNALAGYLVVGNSVSSESLPWRAIPATLTRNGEVVADGNSDAVMGSPIHALHWLLEQLDRRGLSLGAGQVVSTGTFADPVAAEPGCYSADLNDVGSVTVTFT